MSDVSIVADILDVPVGGVVLDVPVGGGILDVPVEGGMFVVAAGEGCALTNSEGGEDMREALQSSTEQSFSPVCAFQGGPSRAARLLTETPQRPDIHAK